MECKPLRQYMKKRGLENHAFLTRVLAHIEHHPLFEHRFFKLLLQGEILKPKLQVWLKQRRFSSLEFPCFLASFLSHLTGYENGGARLAFAKQIWEELGEGDPQKVHSLALARAGFALGVSREEMEAEKKLAGTQHFVETYRNVSRDGSIPKAMAMYALGSEPVIPMEMVLCVEGLKKVPGLREEDWVYFSDHGYHDFRHTAELNDIFLPYLKSPQDEDEAWQGITAIIDARKGLYDGIANAIGI